MEAMTTLLRDFSPIFDSPWAVAGFVALCLAALVAMFYYVATAVRADLAAYRDEDPGTELQLTTDELNDRQSDPWPTTYNAFADRQAKDSRQ